jgi:hypothetical protein
VAQSTVAEALRLQSQNAWVRLKRPNNHSAEAGMARGNQECDQLAELVVVAAHIRSRWASGVGDAQALEEHRYAMRAAVEVGLVPGHLVTPSLLLGGEEVVDMLGSVSRAEDMFAVAL